LNLFLKVLLIAKSFERFAKRFFTLADGIKLLLYEMQIKIFFLCKKVVGFF